MQRVTVVRYTTKPGRADENEKLSRAVFAELKGKPRQPFAILAHLGRTCRVQTIEGAAQRVG